MQIEPLSWLTKRNFFQQKISFQTEQILWGQSNNELALWI
jgi:hypothetical protein